MQPYTQKENFFSLSPFGNDPCRAPSHLEGWGAHLGLKKQHTFGCNRMNIHTDTHALSLYSPDTPTKMTHQARTHTKKGFLLPSRSTDHGQRTTTHTNTKEPTKDFNLTTCLSVFLVCPTKKKGGGGRILHIFFSFCGQRRLTTDTPSITTCRLCDRSSSSGCYRSRIAVSFLLA